MTMSVDVDEATAPLSGLLADVEAGEEVVITRRGQPIARLVAIEPPQRSFVADRGRFVVPDDFDAHLDAGG